MKRFTNATSSKGSGCWVSCSSFSDEPGSCRNHRSYEQDSPCLCVVSRVTRHLCDLNDYTRVNVSLCVCLCVCVFLCFSSWPLCCLSRWKLRSISWSSHSLLSSQQVSIYCHTKTRTSETRYALYSQLCTVFWGLRGTFWSKYIGDATWEQHLQPIFTFHSPVVQPVAVVTGLSLWVMPPTSACW